MNLGGATCKANTLITELPLLFGFDLITAYLTRDFTRDIRTPRFPDIGSPTFGLLDTSMKKSSSFSFLIKNLELQKLTIN